MDLGKLKQAIASAKRVFVWVNIWGDDGEMVEVQKTKLLKAMNADTPNDGAHGGRGDWTPVCSFDLREDGDLWIMGGLYLGVG